MNANEQMLAYSNASRCLKAARATETRGEKRLRHSLAAKRGISWLGAQAAEKLKQINDDAAVK